MVSFTSSLAVLSLFAASASAVTHTVVVGQTAAGAKGLVYTPSTVVAAVGDTVNFQFTGLTHSATLSSFADPCTANSVTPFDVGFVQSNFTFAVNSTKPSWFYCKPHCKAGMVLAINPPTNGTNTFEAFRTAAMSGASANTTSTNGTTTPSRNSTTGTNGTTTGGTSGSTASYSAGLPTLISGLVGVASLIGAGLLL